MTLIQQLDRLPPLLRSSVNNVRITPELGYWPARFENLDTLYQWLQSEAGKVYRYPGTDSQSDQIGLEVVLKHCDKPSRLVTTLLEPYMDED